jgi:hypothetical protein
LAAGEPGSLSGSHSDHHHAGLDLVCVDDARGGGETLPERDLADQSDRVGVRPGQGCLQVNCARAML